MDEKIIEKIKELIAAELAEIKTRLAKCEQGQAEIIETIENPETGLRKLIDDAGRMPD